MYGHCKDLGLDSVFNMLRLQCLFDTHVVMLSRLLDTQV